MPKWDKDIIRKEKIEGQHFSKNIDAKILNKVLTNYIQWCVKKIVYSTQVGFIQGIQDWFQYLNIN